jgi:hypothetical protein
MHQIIIKYNFNDVIIKKIQFLSIDYALDMKNMIINHSIIMYMDG